MEYNDTYYKATEDMMKRPFVWGEHDCCLAAANFYQQVEGKDFAEEWRGKYTTALGAMRLLKAADGMSGILNKLGFKEINPRMAQRGDVIIYSGEEFEGFKETMGIVAGNGREFIMAGGWTRPISVATKAFTLRNIE